MGEAGGVGAHGKGTRCAVRREKKRPREGEVKLQRRGRGKIGFEGFLISPARVPQ